MKLFRFRTFIILLRKVNEKHRKYTIVFLSHFIAIHISSCTYLSYFQSKNRLCIASGCHVTSVQSQPPPTSCHYVSRLCRCWLCGYTAFFVAMSNGNYAYSEVQSVMLFLNVKKFRPSEIHQQLVEAYGEVASNDGDVCKWCGLFNEGRTNIHDEERSGWPTVTTQNLTQKFDDQIHQNRTFTIDKLHQKFLQFSRSVIYQILTDKLH